jgi:peptide/nickel transport system permease protein
MATNKLGSTFADVLKTMFLGRKHATLSLLEEEQMQSPYRTMLRNFVEKRTAMLGIYVFLFIFLACFILPFFFPLDLQFQDPTQQNTKPSFAYMSVPRAMKGNAAQIDGGSVFGVGVDRAGNVHQWGTLTPKLEVLPANMGKVVQVSAGLDHVLALDDQGRVYTWGNNRFMLSPIPPEISRVKIKQVVAGHQLSMALDVNGNLYAWGNTNIINVSFKEYQGLLDKVVLNTTTALAITKDKRVVSLTAKETPFSYIPAAIQGKVVDLTSTDRAAAALTSDGFVHVWGGEDHGVQNVPEHIQGKVVQISAGRGHISALLNDGTVASWGWNNYKQANAPRLKDIVWISSDYFQNYAIDTHGNVHTWGLHGYIMGTDQYGRDLFTRLVSGGRVTLTIGAIAVVISAIIGIIIGSFSGYYGGRVDILLMRLAEVVNAIPFLPLAMILSAIIGSKISETGRIAMIMVILGLLSWPSLARLVRGQILAAREQEFVTAAKAMGITEMKIIFKHILPNVITVVLVNLTLSFALCMLYESSLSYLGFGVNEPNATWGNMLYGCNDSTVMSQYWWRWVFPSIALSLCTISINMAGDGMRDAIDPKSNDR